MGWRDRDYARWTDEERRRFYGSGGAGRAASRAGYSVPVQGHLFGTRARVVPSALVAVIVSLVLALALGQLPRSHPLIPSLHFTLPALSGPAEAGQISLPSSTRLGSLLTLHGRLPGAGTGAVSVEGAYGGGPWRLLATVPVRGGAYEARIRLDRRGLLHLRVTYPDGRRAVGETAVG
ncbi:MAG TPA: hypothetical protein VJ716_09185 [Gaiellaceae bacterium]|nr:hypothetical protein [Gaiellaceae bacterium]